jgi:UDP:flavonoid glycosyltransferase YjiC (YdhE family)
MARILVATVPLTGHVTPMLVLVRALARRDHEIRWYGGKKFAPAIEAAGARFEPMGQAPDWDDADVEAALPALRGKRGLGRVKTQLREMFIAPMGAQLHDLEAISDAFSPDVLLADSAHLGASLLPETRPVSWVGLGISALMFPSVDTAPFGSALPPGTNPGRNKFLNWLIFRVLFGSVNRAYRRARAAAGVPAGAGMYFDVISPDLFLQPTIPELEYPRSDLPAQVRFIGPLVPGTGDRPLPAWWPELEAAHRRGTPIVLVTQGTLATDPTELIAPTVRALAGEDVFVVATTDRLDTVPANTRIAAFVPFHALMPMLSVMVTNGGYGAVQTAVAAGVPLVVAGGSEEKPEIAARIAWSGAGIDLRTGRPKPARVLAAVRRVLDNPAVRTRSVELSRIMATHEGAVAGAALIEQLIAERTAERLAS